MKRKKWMQKLALLLHSLQTKQLLVRMMAGYICILLIVVLFNVSIYFYLKQTLIQEKVDSTKNYLSYMSWQTDLSMSEAKKYMHKFLEESVILRNEQYNTNVSSQMQLTTDLIYMMASCPIIEYAAIYDMDSGVMVTSEGTIGKELLINRIKENTTLSEEEIIVAITTNKHFDYFPIKQGADAKLVLYTGVSYSNAKNDKIIAFIDNKQIQEQLTNEFVEEYAQTYIVNQEFDTLFSMDESIFDKNLMNGQSQYDGQTLVVQESDFQDWIYVSVLNDRRIVQNLGFLKNVFLGLISIMLAICVAISIRFTKQYYSPIAKIVDNYMLNLHSGKTELEAISETMDFLKEKNQQFEEKKLLSGILQSGFYEENLDNLFEYSMFRVAVAYSGRQCLEETAITDFFMSEKEIICKVVYNQYGGCALILNGNEMDYQRTVSILTRLQKLYVEKYQTFIAFGVSNIYEQIMDLNEAYSDAVSAIDYGNSSVETCIYMKQDIMEANQSLYMPIEFEKEMTELVYVRSYDGIKALIEEVFRRNSGVPNVYLRSVVISICNAYKNICKKMDNEPRLSEEVINGEYRVPVIKEHLIAAFTGMEGSMVKENRIEAVRNYVTMYIRENYSDPTISIERVAEDVQLTASYVSTLFKKATGVAFSQYLLQYRIDIAKDMLNNSKEKISAISEKAGFGTYNNFVRMFKKKVGISPSQYRMMNHQIKINDDDGEQ